MSKVSSIAFVVFISLVAAHDDDVDKYGGVYDQYEDEENWYVHDPLGDRANQIKSKPNIVNGDDCSKVRDELQSCQSSIDTLNSCQSSLKTIQEDLLSCKIESKTHIVKDITYFRHFIRIFKDISRPVDEYATGVQVKFSSTNSKQLETLLNEDDEKDTKTILDIMKDSFQPITIPVWDHAKERILSWPVLLGFTGVNVMIILLFLFRNQLVVSKTWRMNVGVILFVCFLCSIPWEWYRMYKEKLAEKTANTIDIPVECKPHEMTPLSSMKLWMRDTFTTADNPCVQYHKDIMVDPFLEVSPLQAASTSISMFVFEPMKHFFSAVGVSFRLLMKEIPLQWQPLVFIALFIIVVIIIMTYSGLEIYTPLFRIGFRNNQREVEHLRLRNRDLEDRLALQNDAHRLPVQNIAHNPENANLQPAGYNIVENIPQVDNENERQHRNRHIPLLDANDIVDDADDVIESLGSLTLNNTQTIPHAPRGQQSNGPDRSTGSNVLGTDEELRPLLNSTRNRSPSDNDSKRATVRNINDAHTEFQRQCQTTETRQSLVLQSVDGELAKNDDIPQTTSRTITEDNEVVYNRETSEPMEHDESLSNSSIALALLRTQSRQEPVEHTFHSLANINSLGTNEQNCVQESSDIIASDITDVVDITSSAMLAAHESDSEYEFVNRE